MKKKNKKESKIRAQIKEGAQIAGIWLVFEIVVSLLFEPIESPVLMHSITLIVAGAFIGLLFGGMTIFMAMFADSAKNEYIRGAIRGVWYACMVFLGLAILLA